MTVCHAQFIRRPLLTRSFVQHHKCQRISHKRAARLCPKAKLDPSEATESLETSTEQNRLMTAEPQSEAEKTALQSFLYPDASELSNSEMPIWDHLDELRERLLIAALAAGGAILTCFCFSKDLVVFLEAPVAEQGVRFLQLSPGEFFFTTFKVAGYAGLLLATPTVLYEVVAWVFPGLTQSEQKQLAPIVFGSSVLFYLGYTCCLLMHISCPVVLPVCDSVRQQCKPAHAGAHCELPCEHVCDITLMDACRTGWTPQQHQISDANNVEANAACRLVFAYQILTPAALQFFVQYADGAVESLWSIDQYFEFVLVLLLSTGLSFQVPVIQVLLGNTGIVSSKQMFAQWRYVVVGATIAAAVLTPSTDPFTQTLLAVPLIGLYLGGAACVRLIESQKSAPSQTPS
ncbi:TPA: hypothetical protein ACH3X2_003474 [Trebouxia sp. C0005]